MDHHHREFWKKNDLEWGLLVFKKNKEKPSISQSSEQKEEVEKLEDALQNHPEFIRKDDPHFQVVEGGIGRYNSIRRNRRRYLETVYLDGEENYVDLSETIKNVDELLSKPDRVVREQDKKNLKLIKKGLITLIGPNPPQGVESALQVPQTTDSATLDQYGEQLATMNAGRFEGGHTLETFKNNDLYSQIESNYTQFASFDEFKSLQNDQIGRYNEQLAKENKALFLSVMQRETDDFTRYRETVSDQEVYVKEQMRRFQSALDIADQGVPGRAGDALKPGVKRIVVGHFFESMRERDPSNVKAESAWALIQLSRSSYFNNESPQQHTQPFERATIGLALAGGRIAKQLENNLAELKTIEKNLTKDDLEWGILDLFVNEEDKKLYDNPRAFLEARKEKIINENNNYQEFLEQAQAVIQKPVDEAGNLHPALVEWDQNGHPDGFVAQGELSHMNRRFERLEMNDNLFAKQEAGRDSISVMRTMGMDLQYTHLLYRKKLLNNPNIDVDNWDRMSPAELAGVMEQIIPPNTMPKGQNGRRALISTLRSMNPNESDPKRIKGYQAAMLQVAEIKNLIRKMNTLEAERKAIMPQIEKEMGEVMGVNDGLRAGFDLLKQQLFSPDWVDKLSAVVAIYVTYKVAEKAWKHDDFLGKALAGGGIAIVANNLVEAATGHDYSKDLIRGFKETADIGLQNRAKNTYEALLVERGTEELDEEIEGQEKISDDEHRKALFVMKNVPYHKLIDWYEASDKAQPGYSEAHEKRMFNRLGADASEVVGGGLTGTEKDRRTRHVMKMAFKNSIAFYGQQNGMSERQAKIALKELWVTSVERRNYTPVLAPPLPFAYDIFHGHQNQLTFETVMSVVASPYLVETTMVKNGYNINTGEIAYNAKKTGGNWIDTSRQFAGEKYDEVHAAISESMETKTPDVTPQPITPESIAEASEGGEEMFKPTVEHEDEDEDESHEE